MEKEAMLPKNIRQIGDIRGREKICVEDYVMTYIRKKEPQEEQGYLGVLLGERQETQEAVYVYIRGILEIPDVNDQKGKNEKNNIKTVNEKELNAGTNTDAQAGTPSGAETVKNGFREKKNSVLNAVVGKKEKTEETQETEKAHPVQDEKTNRPKEQKPMTLREMIDQERANYFPGWEIQGCCVIGTYPTKRLERLGEIVPECKKMIYHLQEQEETIYLHQDGQYRRIDGYFVFYEQNRKMQEYLADVFGNGSVEKEGAPDDAIKSFREKVKEKGREKSRSMLKMASSFFVIALMAAGAVMVNRIDTIQNIISGGSSGETVRYQVQQEGEADSFVSAGQTGAQADGGVAADSAGTSDSVTVSLSGSNAFWEEELEDAEALNSASASGSTVSSDGTGSSADAEALNNASASGSIVSSDGTGSSTDAEALNSASASGSMIASDGTGSSADAEVLNSASASGSMVSPDVTAAQADAEVLNDAAALDSTISPDGTAAQADAEVLNSAAALDSTASPDSTADTENGAASDSSAAASRQVQAAYVIKEGDTLAGICQKYYGGLERLEELCSVNEISDADLIIPGQKIVLP